MGARLTSTEAANQGFLKKDSPKAYENMKRT